MAVKLSQSSYEHATALIEDGKLVHDELDDWSEHRPSAEDEYHFIEEHGFHEYGLWHLGIDAEAEEETRKRYRFPYGDFERVHRCGVLAAESRASHYEDIARAAAHLHGMIEGVD